jgi:hypothetical protein
MVTCRQARYAPLSETLSLSLGTPFILSCTSRKNGGVRQSESQTARSKNGSQSFDQFDMPVAEMPISTSTTDN